MGGDSRPGLGGIIAAPVAALITRRLADRVLMVIVGVMLLSLRSLGQAMGLF